MMRTVTPPRASRRRQIEANKSRSERVFAISAPPVGALALVVICLRVGQETIWGAPPMRQREGRDNQPHIVGTHNHKRSSTSAGQCCLRPPQVPACVCVCVCRLQSFQILGDTCAPLRVPEGQNLCYCTAAPRKKSHPEYKQERIKFEDATRSEISVPTVPSAWSIRFTRYHAWSRATCVVVLYKWENCAVSAWR
jgi:hypothetical protein